MPNIKQKQLERICRAGVLAMGGSDAVADDMVASLISANMEGMDSHGILRLPQYLGLVEEGEIDPKAQPEIVRQDRAVTLLDGHWGFGQVGARVAARLAVQAAKEHGIGAAGLYHVLHVGRLKDYVQMVARENMIGLSFCSAGPAGGYVTPHRGATRRFGTNPLAFAVPRAAGEPLVGDFATSVSAEGKVRLARIAKHTVPDGTLLDVDGKPTNDPNDFYAGGALLPIAAHKGYCLCLFVEIMGGLLVGAGSAALSTEQPGNGFFIIALDVASMASPHGFAAELEDLLALVKSTPAAAGQPPVLLPGDPEILAREQRSKQGIPVDDEVWDALKAMGAKLNLSTSLFAL